jgi:hypothetical protein
MDHDGWFFTLDWTISQHRNVEAPPELLSTPPGHACQRLIACHHRRHDSLGVTHSQHKLKGNGKFTTKITP